MNDKTKAIELLNGKVELNTDDLGMFLYDKVVGKEHEMLPVEEEQWKDTGEAAATIFADVLEFLVEQNGDDYKAAAEQLKNNVTF